MELEEKIGNLVAQSKQVKLEISDLEDALLKREELLNKIEGALEFANSLAKEEEPEEKEKQDA